MIDPMTPKSDWYVISPESHIKVTRMEEMITI